MTATEILRKYTMGDKTLAETNAALKDIGAKFHLDPNRNQIAPDEVDRYGLLDTGTGSYDKVEIKNMMLVNDDLGEMIAFCHFNGKYYRVKGNKLVDL